MGDHFERTLESGTQAVYEGFPDDTIRRYVSYPIHEESRMDSLFSVYLSASHILEQQFSGKRLQRATENKNQAMINMWPYLRTREQEVAERRGIYQKSFLIDLFIGSSPISSALWSSPDHDLQLTIALR